MIRNVLAIDPGACTGWAMFDASKREIVAAGIVFPNRGQRTPELYAGDWIVVGEKPTVYPNERDVDPNNLITLAVNLGRLLERYTQLGYPTEQVEPRSWKGSIAKRPHHNQTRKRLLSTETSTIAAYLHSFTEKQAENAWDAIALALWWARYKERMISR